MTRLQRLHPVRPVLGFGIVAVLILGTPVRAEEASTDATPSPPAAEDRRTDLPDGLTLSPDMQGAFFNFRLVSRVEGGDPRMWIIDPRNFLPARNIPAVPGTYGFFVNFDKTKVENGTQLELSIATPSRDGGVIVAGGSYGYVTVTEWDDYVADTINITNPEQASKFELYQRIVDKTHDKVVMVEPIRVDKP